MSKLVLKLRDQNRRKTVKKFAAKRSQLMALINDQKLSQEERYEARMKLQKLPRDASPVRLRNRCALTGRPRGGFRKFGLGPATRGVPHVRAGTGEAARYRDARRNSRRDQGELVAGRITMSMSDPIADM